MVVVYTLLTALNKGADENDDVLDKYFIKPNNKL